jgi:hypothetical protein
MRYTPNKRPIAPAPHTAIRILASFAPDRLKKLHILPFSIIMKYLSVKAYGFIACEQRLK